MSSKIIIVPVNERIEPVEASKVEATREALKQGHTVLVVGEDAEVFRSTYFADASGSLKIYSGEEGVTLAKAYKNHIHPYKTKNVDFMIVAAEYPVVRFLVEKIFSTNHKVQHVVVESGIRGMLYNDMIQFQQKLMSRYIHSLENIESPDVDEVLAVLNAPSKAG